VGIFVVDLAILKPNPCWFLDELCKNWFKWFVDDQMLHKGIVKIIGGFEATIGLFKFLQLSIRASS